MVSRDVYGLHPHELSPKQRGYLREFVALALIEQEEMEKENRRARS